ncbi:Uncharacterised protein [Vibrio cholerae]|nr:Uncharacterised protein [Vibrio cholerae]
MQKRPTKFALVSPNGSAINRKRAQSVRWFYLNLRPPTLSYDRHSAAQRIAARH